MKTHVLILSLLLLPALCFSQKLEKINIDPINGDTSITTKQELIFTRGGIVPIADYLRCQIAKISLSKQSDVSYSLVLNVTKEYGTTFSILKNSKASIKFFDGQVLQLPCAFDNNSQFIHSSGHVIGNSYSSGASAYQCTGWYTLTADNIQTLKSKEIIYMRIETTEAAFDYEIKKRNSDVIKKHLELITSTIH